MKLLECDQLLLSTLSDSDADELARVLKALAHPVRLKLVNIIATSGEACACDFPSLVGKTQATVSHHLTQLTQAGILQREQRGKWAWFQVDSDHLAEICAVIC
ncbi:MAG: helix-turn-helix transcriptional regulator [Actinobacteria bacterium]|nr:helix-turn-helix transcriptional regulator [Actinomycetota bacterium]